MKISVLALKNKTSIREEIKTIFKGTFSETQINFVLNNKNKVKVWSTEDITKAFTIRYLKTKLHLFEN